MPCHLRGKTDRGWLCLARLGWLGLPGVVLPALRLKIDRSIEVVVHVGVREDLERVRSGIGEAQKEVGGGSIGWLPGRFHRLNSRMAAGQRRSVWIGWRVSWHGCDRT